MKRELRDVETGNSPSFVQCNCMLKSRSPPPSKQKKYTTRVFELNSARKPSPHAPRNRTNQPAAPLESNRRFFVTYRALRTAQQFSGNRGVAGSAMRHQLMSRNSQRSPGNAYSVTRNGQELVVIRDNCLHDCLSRQGGVAAGPLHHDNCVERCDVTGESCDVIRTLLCGSCCRQRPTQGADSRRLEAAPLLLSFLPPSTSL